MGRRDEFAAGHGGAYGNFQPEPVDIDLSDKVTDHPHRGQLGEFHDPGVPMSKQCLEPGCGRLVHEHRSQHLPPTREAYEMMTNAVAAERNRKRAGKEKEARESHENDELMKGHHGIGEHTVTGQGWSDRGPRTAAELRRHMIDDHQVDSEDMDYIPHLARSHKIWHDQGDDDDHTHGPRRKH